MNGKAKQAEPPTKRLADMIRKHRSRSLEKIMYTTSKNTSKSAPKTVAKFHDGVRLRLRLKSGESIIATQIGVIKAKTVRWLPEEQKWCAENVLSVRGAPLNPVPGVRGDHIPIEVGGSRHAERGEDEHKSGRSMTIGQQLPYQTRR